MTLEKKKDFLLFLRTMEMVVIFQEDLKNGHLKYAFDHIRRQFDSFLRPDGNCNPIWTSPRAIKR